TFHGPVHIAADGQDILLQGDVDGVFVDTGHLGQQDSMIVLLIDINARQVDGAAARALAVVALLKRVLCLPLHLVHDRSPPLSVRCAAYAGCPFSSRWY